jgi:hypothetical protein
MWKTTMNDCSDAAKLHVLTLCTGEGACIHLSQKKSSVTKIVTQVWLSIFSCRNVLHRKR